MASKVEVLCPNGHRVNVKTTPNTKIVQILDEVCSKKGFLPTSDYELKHGSSRKALDLTLTVRFAGLPNHAKLELIKAAKAREEANVTLALQLDTGERLQHEFCPQMKLWDVLLHWEKEQNRQLTNGPLGHHPVCVYMREEVSGEYALQHTTLHSLGLIGGRAAIRLVYKSLDDNILEEVRQKIDKEKKKQTKAADLADKMDTQTSERVETPDDKWRGEDNRTNKPLISEVIYEAAEEAAMETDQRSTSLHDERQRHMQAACTAGDGATAPGDSRQQFSRSADNRRQRPDPSQNSGPDTSIPGVQIFRPGEVLADLPPEQEQIARQFAEAIMPGIFPQRSPAEVEHLRQEREKRLQQKAARPRPQPAPPALMFTEFKFPEETKGKDLYNNEQSETDVDEYKPCDREAVLYNVEQVHTSMVVPEEPGDDFFEVTETDMKRLWQDFHKNLTDMEEQPLMTQAMRKNNMESRLSKYAHVFIRVTFPDKLVLQGTFRPRETVYSLQKFVKEHLHEKTTPFYLYTSPPKNVLDDTTQTLLQAGLVPMTVVYFGSETKSDHYLSEAVLAEMSSQTEANNVLVNHMPSKEDSESASSSSHHTNKRSAGRGQGQGRSQTDSSGGKGGQLPKWFKIGKK